MITLAEFKTIINETPPSRVYTCDSLSQAIAAVEDYQHAPRPKYGLPYTDAIIFQGAGAGLKYAYVFAVFPKDIVSLAWPYARILMHGKLSIKDNKEDVFWVSWSALQVMFSK